MNLKIINIKLHTILRIKLYDALYSWKNAELKTINGIMVAAKIRELIYNPLSNILHTELFNELNSTLENELKINTQ